MTKWLDPDTWARTYSDPLSVAILLVDLFPAVAVLLFGWDAAALVLLYWIENLVIGVFALLRMIAASAREHPIGLLGMLFLGPFFIVHYGMFCFVHGIFILGFAGLDEGANGFPDPAFMVQAALSSGDHMTIFVGAIIALQLTLFVTDFIGKGQFRETSVEKEMGAPYARVVVLHFGLFAGMAALLAIGQPMAGILGLILLRAAWGIFLTQRRSARLEPQ